jgi:hypothetical protein
MGLLLGGCATLAGISVLSAALLPRGALVLVSGFAFATTMIIAGLLALVGA